MAKTESLLDKLKRLYTKVFLVSLHNRINQYHSLLHSNNHHEISGTLHDWIDETVKNISENDTGLHITGLEYYEMKRSFKSASSNKSDNQETTLSSMTINGLSLYFKRHKALEKDPAVAARLRRCVYDHVHSAHRLARVGDDTTAKMHANIACDALKTLSHYMPNEEYDDFSGMINKQINEDLDKSNS
ncbi:MAG: hypothetical protein KAU21_11630 [Gammaproteobacteria bacterium]|nr:hypothetical protein [Gammaproteobacteria bacterium]